MNLQNDLKVYGDTSFRGECPKESAEQITFFNWLRKNHPDIAMAATHVRNEGNRSIQQTMRQKAEGMQAGFADIIIAGCPAFVCELKRKDHTKSRWQKGQQESLMAAQELGAFVCVALGYEAAIEAFTEWNTTRTIKSG